MIITLKNPKNNSIRQIKAGFSWTTLFFGFFPALFRGDVKWFGIMILSIIITLGLSNLIFPFIYNKLNIKDLLHAGYVAADNVTLNYLKNKSLISE